MCTPLAAQICYVQALITKTHTCTKVHTHTHTHSHTLMHYTHQTHTLHTNISIKQKTNKKTKKIIYEWKTKVVFMRQYLERERKRPLKCTLLDTSQLTWNVHFLIQASSHEMYTSWYKPAHMKWGFKPGNEHELYHQGIFLTVSPLSSLLRTSRHHQHASWPRPWPLFAWCHICQTAGWGG